MTNNVKSCKKINGRVQTFRFSVFTMGQQELCAKNTKTILLYTVDILFNINILVLNPKSLELDTKLEIFTLSFHHYQKGLKKIF